VAYYRITKVENDIKAHSDQLYREVVEEFPDANVKAQRLSDLHRATVLNNFYLQQYWNE
jgi:hypothetical protein